MRNADLPSWVEIIVATGIVIAFQLLLGAYGRDFASHSDEAAHFVTGVMVYDYCTTSLGKPPVSFAEEYYIHYPKVALGHWPPGFYLLQAVCYAVLGVSKSSAMLLIAVVNGVVFGSLYHRMRRELTIPLALLSLVVFVSLPLVRVQSVLFMSDMSLVLFAMLAVLAFHDYLVSRQTAKLIAFAIWSVLAILTKPLGLALALYVPLSIALHGHPRMLFDRKLLLTGGLIGILTAPYYWWTWNAGLGLHGSKDVGGLAKAAIRTQSTFRGTDELIAAIPPLLAATALVGCLVAVTQRRTNSQAPDASLTVSMLAWVLANLAFLYVAPVHSETRFFLPMLLGLMIPFAHGLQALLAGTQRLQSAKRTPFLAWLPVWLLVLACLTSTFGHIAGPVVGYAAAARKIPDARAGRVSLVSADEIGEGSLVAERLLCDRSRSEFVLRASKVLASSTWAGSRYRAKFSTVDQLRDYLDSIPVEYIVIDDLGYRRSAPAHHQLLKQMIHAFPEQFELQGFSSIEYQDVHFPNAAGIFKNRSAGGRSAGAIEIDMQHTLGRTLKMGAAQD